MDIYNYLKKDHRLVEDLMEQVVRARSGQKRMALFEEIKQELKLHMETEEATFYSALASKNNLQEKMEHAEEEHDEGRDYIAILSKLSPDSDKWIEQFGEFKHAITHHVKEEEEEIFKKAKQVLSDDEAKELAQDMDMMKRQMKQKKAS